MRRIGLLALAAVLGLCLAACAPRPLGVGQPHEAPARAKTAVERASDLLGHALLYPGNRVLDLMDVVGFGVGWGYLPEARFRVGRHVAVGAGLHGAGLVGVRSRSEWGGWIETRSTLRAGPYGTWKSDHKMVHPLLAPFVPAGAYALPAAACILSAVGYRGGRRGRGKLGGPL